MQPASLSDQTISSLYACLNNKFIFTNNPNKNGIENLHIQIIYLLSYNFHSISFVVLNYSIWPKQGNVDSSLDQTVHLYKKGKK